MACPSSGVKVYRQRPALYRPDFLYGIICAFLLSVTHAALADENDDEEDTATLRAITISGEKQDRSLMKTSSSVIAFDELELSERPRMDTVNDLLERIPNITTTGSSNLAPAVRGVDGTGPTQGSFAFFAGVRPRFNVQLDGRPASYNEVVFGDFALWDVEQVEVFRGPLSTIQGRNAIAGTLVVNTKDPTYHHELRGRLIGGNHDTRQGSFVASGPVVDDEIAMRLAVDRRSSQSFVEMAPYPGVDNPGEFESLNVRGKLLFEPKALDGFRTLLTLNHSDFTNPQVEAVGRPFEDLISPFVDPVFNPRTTSGIVDTSWILNDNFTLENTLSLTDLRVTRSSPIGQGNVLIEGNEFVAEPRLRFNALDDRLSGLTGVYLFHSEQDESIDFGGDNRYDDSTTTMALFGEATLTVFDDIDLTAGARLEREHRERFGGLAPVFDIDLDETYEVFLPKLGIAWHATEDLTVGAVVAKGYNAGGAGVTFNPPFVAYTYDPEYVWNYEGYARAQMFNGKLALTGNVFYAEYEDMQLPFLLGPLSSVIRNAEEVETYGSEIGAEWLVTPGWRLFTNLGLLHTEITKFPNSGIEHNELARAPTLTADLGTSYYHPSGFDISADARYSDAYFSEVENPERGEVDSYWIFNMQAGYTYKDFRIFSFVKNLFDTDSPLLLTPGTVPAGDTAYLIQPRTYGVGIEMTF